MKRFKKTTCICICLILSFLMYIPVSASDNTCMDRAGFFVCSGFHPTLFPAAVFLLLAVIIAPAVLYRIKGQKQEKARLNEYERFISYVCRINDIVLEIDINSLKQWYYSTLIGKVSKVEISSEQLQRLSGTLHPEDAKKLNSKLNKEYLSSLIANNAEFYFECRIIKNGPDPRWYAFTIQGLAQDALHPNNIMILGREIENAKREEDEKRKALQDALAAAQQASETKSSFLSRMSHEMRTPLNAIIGYLELGKKYIHDPEKLEDYMVKSDIAAHQLLSIINNVLDMASIESGKLHLERVQFELTEEIHGIFEMFEIQALNKQLDFQVHMPDEKVFIVGDPLRLNQILINLLSNAVKFTPPHGRVSLSVQKIAQQERRVYFRFKVADTGIGMSEEYMEHLFDPFEQHDSSIARKYGGSGLGMSITKNLVTMKQGTISVDSKLGEGTIFTVNLSFELLTQHPDEENNSLPDGTGAVPEHTDSSKNKMDFTGKRLLLVEDNQMNLEIAAELLAFSGFEVDYACDGQKALEKFLSSKPDTYQLILMDIQMPVMDGYETTEKIRASAHPQAGSIPIFAMTANAFSEDVNKAMSVGMNGHIAKPVDVTKMLEIISEALRD